MQDVDEREMEESATLLEEYGSLEGTELGEMWILLASMWSRRDYIPKPLLNALKKEIKATVKYIKENVTIKEEDVTTTIKIKTIELNN